VPDFARPTVAGDRFDTRAARGKVLVVKFFAKYCEPCKRTLPAVEALHKERPGVSFVGISEDEHEADSVDVVRQYGLTFPVVHDEDNVLSGRYRVDEMPVTFVVDRGGQIVWVGKAKATEDGLARAIEAAQ
jgi:cytochrome c biogenesis protein CcmG/thiol:disulfide interchange protein DsbE